MPNQDPHGPLESRRFSLADVLEILKGPPTLTKRMALHFLSQELVVLEPKTGTPTGHRKYSYRDLLAFSIATWLAVDLRAPVPVVKNVLRVLRQRGFFLLPEEVREIKALREKDMRPADVRALLEDRYRIPYLHGVRYRSGVVIDGQTTWISPEDRNPRRAVRYMIAKATELTRLSPRPWPLGILLQPHSKREWPLATIALPTSVKSDEEDPGAEGQDAAERRHRLLALLLARPMTLSLNLYELERIVQRRCRIHLDGTEEDEQGDEWLVETW